MVEWLKNNKVISIGTTIILLSALGYAFLYINNQKNEIINDIRLEEPMCEEKKEMIIVDIAGEVISPGVYELETGARVKDLVIIAGGLTDKADINNVNLAYKLTDGIKIIIPKKEEVKKIAAVPKKTTVITALNRTPENTGIVNINNATIEELDKLDGIGESIAKKVIEYRNEKGRFNNVEEIKEVPGIGDAKFEKIKNKIEV